MSELQEMNNKIHERLRRENELLIADNKVLQAKWEGQGMMIQKLHKEIEQLKEDVHFFQNKQEVNVKITQELASLNDDRVTEILTKTRITQT